MDFFILFYLCIMEIIGPLLLVMLILVVKERMKERELHKYFSVCPTVIDG